MKVFEHEFKPFRTGALISPCGERIAATEWGFIGDKCCQRVRLISRNGKCKYGTSENTQTPLWIGSEFSVIVFGSTTSEIVEMSCDEIRSTKLGPLKILDRIQIQDGHLAKVSATKGTDHVWHRKGIRERNHELVVLGRGGDVRETISASLDRSLHVLKMLQLKPDRVIATVRKGEVFDSVETGLGGVEMEDGNGDAPRRFPLASLLAVAPDGDAVLLGWEETRGTCYSNEGWQLWKASAQNLSRR